MGIFGNKTSDEVEKKGKDAVEKTTVKKDVEKKQSKKKETKEENNIASTTGAYNTIIAPIITEKSHEMVANHKYTFRITKTTSKTVIKKVVEDMYNVTVENVNIIVVKPKRRTVKQDRGYQKLYKKAIVTVNKNDHIAVFEGV